MDRPFRVVAIMSAFNEEDIIGQVVGHLIDEGILVYLLDHGSTDDTVAEVEPYLGKGLLAIDRLPSATPLDVSWESVLRRKEALAAELEADWFIHHDADEFRESPWPRMTLVEAIRTVDALGYNAIDFEVLNFWPTHDRFHRGDDVRAEFRFYEHAPDHDKLQVKCWKKADGPVVLTATGGHDVTFPDRRVFPIRFLLRHYPIRGQAHGERKVFRERRLRFAAERSRGWHVQYDGIEPGHRFVRSPGTLTAYDPDRVRLGLLLRHRAWEELEGTAARLRRAAEVAAAYVSRHGLATEQLDRIVTAQRRTIDALEDIRITNERLIDTVRTELRHTRSTVGQLERELQHTRQELDRVGGELATARRCLEDVLASRTWRWTAPLRTLLRAFGVH
ncbi:MAG TPA: glycosyltransferase family 2 protein [Candidatus Tectomicrobia bacterium]|nr:glycosyltransferase family 2 protein [Candidatus Tectomicrobia bacterium]